MAFWDLHTALFMVCGIAVIFYKEMNIGWMGSIDKMALD